MEGCMKKKIIKNFPFRLKEEKEELCKEYIKKNFSLFTTLQFNHKCIAKGKNKNIKTKKFTVG
jgi:hypothetical protein